MRIGTLRSASAKSVAETLFCAFALTAYAADDRAKEHAVWMYQMPEKGLSVELTGKGTKYYKDDDLN
jgi:hypothetical protein